MFCLQELDEAGAETFRVLVPQGTPLPARRHHSLSAEGKVASLCLEIYQRLDGEQPERLSKVRGLGVVDIWGTGSSPLQADL